MTPSQILDGVIDKLFEAKLKNLKQSKRESEYASEQSNRGVWMSVASPYESVSRLIAIDAMKALDLDPNDFRTRDKIINGINNRVNGTLDAVDLQH